MFSKHLDVDDFIWGYRVIISGPHLSTFILLNSISSMTYQLPSDNITTLSIVLLDKLPIWNRGANEVHEIFARPTIGPIVSRTVQYPPCYCNWIFDMSEARVISVYTIRSSVRKMQPGSANAIRHQVILHAKQLFNTWLHGARKLYF